MSKIDDIKAKLTELGIAFDEDATLKELKALLPDEGDDTDLFEGDEDESKEKQEYRKIITAYAKQNPVKFQIKKEAFREKLGEMK